MGRRNTVLACSAVTFVALTFVIGVMRCIHDGHGVGYTTLIAAYVALAIVMAVTALRSEVEAHGPHPSRIVQRFTRGVQPVPVPVRVEHVANPRQQPISPDQRPRGCNWS